METSYPLPELIKRVEKTINDGVVGDLSKVCMPNPTLARIRCLPKNHKPGIEMREIIVATNLLAQELPRWLISKLNRLGLKSK